MTAVAITLVFIGGFAAGIVLCVLIDFLYGEKPTTEDTSSGLPTPELEITEEYVDAVMKFHQMKHSQDIGNN